MKTLLLILLSTILLAGACRANDLSTATSTLSNQTKVAVTVYNAGFGVVRDERALSLPKGTVELRFMEVASKIQPETVQIDPVTAGDKLAVLEQNYEYDLMSPAKLMEKYVGRKVTLIQRNDFQGERVPVEATLLSYNDRLPIYRIGGKIVIHRPTEEVVLPSIPENLVSEPTLVWLLHNQFDKEQTIVANYMTGGMRWNADYVAVLAPDEKTCNLNGWVTIDNRSGATFKDAQLKLVAGDVRKVRKGRHEQFDLFADEEEGVQMARAPGRGFVQEAMFEYHMYTLERPSTLKQNQQKQIALLEAQNVALDKTYRCVGSSGWFRGRRGDTIKNIKIGVFISFVNSETNRLGMPLPKGIMRVYKADSSGNNQFIGEDRIDHTPRDEEIELKLGDAFDVVAERRQTDFEKLGNRAFETAWEIKIRNHKKEDIVVEVVEPFHGDWTILKSSLEYEKRDAWTAVFKVPVKADSEAVLTYRVRVKW